MIGAFARLTITARDAAVLAPPAIVRGRARAVRASARSNATGAVAVAEVVVRIVGLEEAEVAVDGVVQARHLVLTAAGRMWALAIANGPMWALAIANGPIAERTKALDSGCRRGERPSERKTKGEHLVETESLETTKHAKAS